MKKCYYRYCLLCMLLLNASIRIYAQEKLHLFQTDTINVQQLLRQAEIQRSHSNVNQALYLSQKALRLSSAQHSAASIAKAMLFMSLCYKDKGEYLKSKQLLNLARPFCVKASSQQWDIMILLYSHLGVMYGLLGDNDSSIYIFHEALGYIKSGRTQDSFYTLDLYSNLGTSWLQNEELDKALYYHKKAEALALQLKDTLELAIVYSNIGTIYRIKKDSIRAIKYFNTSLALYEHTKVKIYPIQFLYYAIGTVQQRLPDAMLYYNKALAMDSNSVNAAAVYEEMGHSYFMSGNYSKAEIYYKKAEALGEKKGLVGNLVNIYPKLAFIYEHWQRYQLAYQYQKRFTQLNDSLHTIKKDKMVNQLDIKYRVAEKDKVLAENKVQLYQQQKWMIAFAAGLLLLVSLLLGIYRRNSYKQKSQKVRLQSLEQQQKIEQLQAKMQGEEEERSRIARELHDGINVLLSATKMNYASLGKEYKGLAETASYGEIMGLLNEMGLELRTITYKLVPELLIQQSLPDAIETFCDIIRKSKALYIEFQSWGSFTALPAEYCFAIYRVAQELVHNVIKHANATSVLIQLRHQDGILCFTVDDNGDGFSNVSVGGGLGLQSIRSRIENLGGQVVLSSKIGEGTSVEVELMTIVSA